MPPQPEQKSETPMTIQDDIDEYNQMTPATRKLIIKLTDKIEQLERELNSTRSDFNKAKQALEHFVSCYEVANYSEESFDAIANIAYSLWGTQKENATLREHLEEANGKLSLTVQSQIEASAEALDWKQKHTELFFEGEGIERELRESLSTALSQLTALTAEVKRLKGEFNNGCVESMRYIEMANISSIMKLNLMTQINMAMHQHSKHLSKPEEK